MNPERVAVLSLGVAFFCACGKQVGTVESTEVRDAEGAANTPGALPSGPVTHRTLTDGSLTPVPVSGCAPLSLDTSAVDQSAADTYAWSDARCARRTAALLRNDAMDSFGEAGGYLRSYSYEASGVTRTCTGTGQNDWYGFGYVVLHYGTSNLDINTQSTLGTTSVVLAGRHHAIHQFTWSTSPGGPVVATAQWLFATGRDHPLFTVTLDASSAGPNAVDADSRAPYGDLAWDGMNGEVAGVSWGDAYQLKTTGSGPVTPSSAWDYTTPNTIPYAMEWSTAVDAEMGLVATQAWSTRVQGGDYGDGLLAEKWGTTGTALLTDLPEWLWPFQLNQYDLADETTSHRVAWGATFGAVGQTTYQAFGKTLSGYPRYSYSLFVVLGLHSEQAVGAEVGDIEAVQGSSLTASRGVVSTEGPAGVARTDSAPYVPAGFDPVYAAWDATMASSAATLTLTVGSGSLESPMFHLHGYTSSTPPSSVTLGGRALAADTDYFATVDAATQSLWITLATAVSGSVTVTVDP